MKQRLARSLADLETMEQAVLASAQTSLAKLQELLTRDGGLSALAALKFGEAVCDPLDSSRSLNLVEQLNQSFTYLASIAATAWLFEHHPENAPYILNLGTAPGSDIMSQDGATPPKPLQRRILALIASSRRMSRRSAR